jgi:hypothetical protein
MEGDGALAAVACLGIDLDFVDEHSLEGVWAKWLRNKKARSIDLALVLKVCP